VLNFPQGTLPADRGLFVGLFVGQGYIATWFVARAHSPRYNWGHLVIGQRPELYSSFFSSYHYSTIIL